MSSNVWPNICTPAFQFHRQQNESINDHLTSKRAMRQQQKQDIQENELAMRSKAGGTCMHSILAKHKSRLNTLINTLFVSFVWRMPRLGFCPHKAGAIGDWQLFAGGSNQTWFILVTWVHHLTAFTFATGLLCVGPRQELLPGNLQWTTLWLGQLTFCRGQDCLLLLWGRRGEHGSECGGPPLLGLADKVAADRQWNFWWGLLPRGTGGVKTSSMFCDAHSHLGLHSALQWVDVDDLGASVCSDHHVKNGHTCRGHMQLSTVTGMWWRVEFGGQVECEALSSMPVDAWKCDTLPSRVWATSTFEQQELNESYLDERGLETGVQGVRWSLTCHITIWCTPLPAIALLICSVVR